MDKINLNNISQTPAEKYDENSLDKEHKAATVNDKKTDTHLKKFYARRVILVLKLQLLILDLIFIAAGLGYLKYNNQDYVLHIFITGTLLQLFGIMFIISRYLFSKR